MDATLSTFIAVAGTLLGALVTHLFQRGAARRAESFATRQQLRSERIGVYSDFAGALAEFRRGQYDRWHRHDEDREGSAARDTRTEAYRLRGVALHALFRVQLVAGDQAVTDAARSAYEATSGCVRADDRTQLSVLGDHAREEVERFIMLAAADLSQSGG